MGNPILSAADSASSNVDTISLSGCFNFNSSSNALKRSRSSAKSIELVDVPKIGIFAASRA